MLTLLTRLWAAMYDYPLPGTSRRSLTDLKGWRAHHLPLSLLTCALGGKNYFVALSRMGPAPGPATSKCGATTAWPFQQHNNRQEDPGWLLLLGAETYISRSARRFLDPLPREHPCLPIIECRCLSIQGQFIYSVVVQCHPRVAGLTRSVEVHPWQCLICTPGQVVHSLCHGPAAIYIRLCILGGALGAANHLAWARRDPGKALPVPFSWAWRLSVEGPAACLVFLLRLKPPYIFAVQFTRVRDFAEHLSAGELNLS